MAYDWITGNLYYASQREGVIGVCNQRRDCVSVVSDNVDGQGLALDPKNG